MKGLIRLAKCKTAPTSDNGFRCEIQALDTGAVYVAVANPSPYMWYAPEANALVYFLDAPYGKRILGVLHDIDTERSYQEIGQKEEVYNPVTMSPGDVYIGKYGRATFYQSGDVDVSTYSTRNRLFLNQETGVSELSGFSLDMFTLNKNIRILTKSTKGDGVGDSLVIERNKGDADNTNISTISLDDAGNYYVFTGLELPKKQGDSPILHSVMEMSITGDILSYVGGTNFADALASIMLSEESRTIEVGSTGFISLYCADKGKTIADATCSITMDYAKKDVQAHSHGTISHYCGDSTFTSADASMLIDGPNKAIRFSSKGDFFIKTSKAANVEAESLAIKAKSTLTGDVAINGKLTQTGDVSVKGKYFGNGDVNLNGKVNISGDFTMKGSKASIEAGQVNIGGNGAMALVIAQKLIALFNSHVHGNGNLGAPTTPPMMPLTEIQIGTIVTKAK